jgi:gliding motility-associated-like protein
VIESNGQQLEGSHWLFGDSVGLSFNQGPEPVLNNFNKSRSERGPATISDERGNLLFYTDGEDIYNRLGQIMPNGDNVSTGGRGTSKNTVISKVPGSQFRYWVIIAGGIDLFISELKYTEVDMRLNNGLGGIVPGKKGIVIQQRIFIAVALADHANGVDKWLIVNKGRRHISLGGPPSYNYEFYLLDSSGIHYVKSQQAISTHGLQYEEQDPTFKVSPNSQYLLVAGGRIDDIKLFEIARDTGGFKRMVVVSNSLEIGWSGVAFSPNSKYLYVSGAFMHNNNWRDVRIHQFNLDTSMISYNSPLWKPEYPRIPITGENIYNYQGRRLVMTDLQLAPNGKIYVIPYSGAKFLAVIECPNERGANSRFRDSAVWLGGRSTGSHFPVLNQTLFVNAGKLQVQASKDTICAGDSVEILGYGAGAEQFQWFRNAETASFSNQPRVKVAPNQNTTYRVRGSGTCLNPKDTAITIIVRTPPPTPKIVALKPSTIQDTIGACIDDSIVLRATFSASMQNNQYYWENGVSSILRTIRIDSNYLNQHLSGVQQIILTTTNRYCTRSDTVWVRVLPRPAPPQVSLSPAADSVGYCPGQQVTLTATTGYSSYYWSTGQTGQSTTFSRPLLASYPGGSYPIHLQATDSNGCRSASSDTTIVTFRPTPLTPQIQSQPPPMADGISRVCPGDSIELQAQSPYPAGTAVQWRWSTGDSTQNIATIPTSTQITTLQLYLLKDGCPSPADTQHIATHPTPVISHLTGSLSVCPGIQGVAYQAIGTAIDSVLWQLSTQYGSWVNIPLGYLPQSDTVKVNWGTQRTDSAFLITVPKSQYGCVGDTFFRYVRINPLLKPAPPLGDTLVCTYVLTQGYQSAVSPGSVYTWTATYGSLLSGQGTPQVTVQWQGAGQGTLQYHETVTTTDTVCAGTSPPIRIYISRSPDSTLRVIGDSALCQKTISTWQLNGYPGSSYQWQSPGMQTTSTSGNQISGSYPQAGQYLIRVTETTDSGCVGRPIQSTIRIHPLPQVNAGADQSLCANGSTVIGSATLQPYRYSWYPTQFLISPQAAQTSVTPNLQLNQRDSSLTYTLTATDTLTGCLNSDSVRLTLLQSPHPQLRTPNSSYCGGSTASLIHTTIPQNTLLYRWHPGSLYSDSLSQTAQLQIPETQQDSTLHIRLETIHLLTQCRRTDSAILQITANPKITITHSPATNLTDSLCSGVSYMFTPTTTQPNAESWSWMWQNAAGQTIGQEKLYTQTYETPASTSMQITVTATTTDGCRGSKSIQRSIKPRPATDLSGLNPYLCPEQWEGYRYTLQNPRAGSTYIWEATNGQITRIDDNTAGVTVIWEEGSAQHSLSIQETTIQGCPGQPASITLKIDSLLTTPGSGCTHADYPLEAPNLITANADGKNEVFIVKNSQYYPDLKLSIYNRWGKQLYQKQPYRNDWSGEPGLYYYQIESRYGQQKGWVQVVK